MEETNMEPAQQTAAKDIPRVTDLDALLQMQYVFEHFGFIPKWLNVRIN